MPILRVETRPKLGDAGKGRKSHAHARGASSRRGLRLAAGVGVIGGLIVVAGLAAALIQRRAGMGDRAREGAHPATSDALAIPASATDALSGTVTASQATYRPGDTIAWIRGEPYTYAQLLQAVRVARVLAYFTGDAVPSDTSPEMPAFQVQMLRRQIDLTLLKQAMRRDGVEAPPMDGAMLLETFLRDGQVDRAQLETQMAANGVTQADLENWLRDAALVNVYIQDKVAPGKQGSEREAAIRDWLSAEWDTQEIVIRFYDPDKVLPRATATPAGGVAPTGEP